MMLNKVVIFPTDTVYGIGASLYDAKSIERIYEIKHRDRSKPLAVLCANLSQIEEIAYVDEISRKLIKTFLPGPFTLILKIKENLKESFGFDTIGVRIPNYQKALEILEKYGPMATTSVNDSGEKEINDYNEIKEKYSSLVDEIYYSNEVMSKLPSTVVKIENNKAIVLREGAITKEEIEKLI